MDAHMHRETDARVNSIPLFDTQSGGIIIMEPSNNNLRITNTNNKLRVQRKILQNTRQSLLLPPVPIQTDLTKTHLKVGVLQSGLFTDRANKCLAWNFLLTQTFHHLWSEYFVYINYEITHSSAWYLDHSCFIETWEIQIYLKYREIYRKLVDEY